MAGHLASHPLVPDLVLCSTALRSRQTCERLAPALAGAPVRYERRIYAASADDLLARVQALPDTVTSVLLIGHNPGLEDLALRLARPAPERDRLAAKFPTGALATLEATTLWSALGPGCATLTAYVRPRDLRG